MKSVDALVGGTGVNKDRTIRDCITTDQGWCTHIIGTTNTSRWKPEMMATKATLEYYFRVDGNQLIAIRPLPTATTSMAPAPTTPITPPRAAPTAPMTPAGPINLADAMMVILHAEGWDLEATAFVFLDRYGATPFAQRAAQILELAYHNRSLTEPSEQMAPQTPL
jgi:hypothetical protein